MTFALILESSLRVDDKIADFTENCAPQSPDFSPQLYSIWNFNSKIADFTESVTAATQIIATKLSGAAPLIKSYIQSGELDASTASEISSIKDHTKQQAIATLSGKLLNNRRCVGTNVPMVGFLLMQPRLHYNGAADNGTSGT